MFEERPVILSINGVQELFDIPNPLNVQLYHVQNIRDQLLSGTKHPSTGRTAAHTSWVMDQILK